MGKPVDEIAGYKVIQLQLKENSQSIHHLFVKEHKVREKTAEKPEGRTIFALGVPPYATEASIANAFSVFDIVENVFFHKEPTPSIPPVETSKFFQDHPPIKGFKVAYVVFKTPKGVLNAFNLDPSVRLILSTNAKPLKMGLDLWIEEYNKKIVTDVDGLEQEIDRYMGKFDSAMETEDITLKKQAAEADDEGWVAVNKKSRKKGFPRKESVLNKIKKKEEGKKSRKELKNFYRFQIRESKKEGLEKMREQFAQDQRRVALMKEARQFKPL